LGRDDEREKFIKKWHRPLSFVKLNFRDALKSQQSYLDFMDNFVKSVQIYPYHCFFNQANGMIIHNDITVSLFVIPGLTRNPVFPWIPASAGMTCSVVINDAMYKLKII
jgi:hypothetical protein